MKKRVLCLVGIMVGVLIAVVPYAVACVVAFSSSNAPSAGMIGGADAPTLLLVIRQTTREFWWVVFTGFAVWLGSVVVLINSRREKDR